MGIDPEVYTSALGFMRVSFVGMIFTFGFYIPMSHAERGTSYYSSLDCWRHSASQFHSRPFLYLGFGSFHGLGVMGAALATLGTQSLAMIIGFLHPSRREIRYPSQNPRDFKPDFPLVKKTFALGFPASIEMSARALGLTVMTFLIAAFGTHTVASYGVASNLMQFVMIFCMGLSVAISALIRIGAGILVFANETAKVGAVFSFLLMM